MHNVIIKNSEGITTNQHFTDTLELAEQWLNGQTNVSKPFGVYLNERWLPEYLEGVETRQVEIQPAQAEYSYESEGKTIIVPAVDAIMRTEYLHPAEYTYTITDITAEYEAEQRKLNRIARGEIFDSCCKEVIHYIQGYNDDSGLTLEQIQTMVSTFSEIDVLLSKGYAKTARDAIQVIVPNGVVTEEMKSDILTIFTKYPID